jgi:hypothetical protein
MLRFVDQEEPTPLEPVAPQVFSTSKLEQDMGDQAGLQPLPLGRMAQQAGRPMSPAARGQDTPYGAPRNLRVNPALHDLTIQRNQRNQQTIDSWNPLAAESKQRLNNTNPNPRSKPSAPNENAGFKWLQELGNTADLRKRQAFNAANQNDPMWSKTGGEFKQWLGQEQQVQRGTDASLFLTSKERQAVKSLVFDYLDSKADGRSKLEEGALPPGINSRFPQLGNDLLYEWNARRQRQLRERTLDTLEIRRDTIRGI